VSRVPYRKLLRNKAIRRLWYAQAISVFGDWLIVGMVISLVSTLSGKSSSAVGALVSVRILPALLFGAVIGVLVDRYDRKHTMITADLLRAALVLSLVFVRQLWYIYLVVFMTEMFSLFFVPAKNATIPNIVAEDELAEANSLSYTTDQAFMFLGLTTGAVLIEALNTLVGILHLTQIPVLGLFVPKLLGAQAGLTLDAISFLVSAALIATIRVPRRERRVERLSFLLVGRDLREGYRFLRDEVSLRSIMTGVAIAPLGVGTLYTAGFLYTSDVLHIGQGAAGFVALFAMFALGMLAGALGAPFFGDRFGWARTLAGGLALFGVALLLFSLTSLGWVAALIAVFAGAAMAILYVAGWTYMQETVRDELRGRVFVTLEMLIRVSLLVSLTLSGAFADLLRGLLSRAHLNSIFLNGPRVTLLAGAVVVMGAAANLWSVTRRMGPQVDEA
jgi:dTMP kinase